MPLFTISLHSSNRSENYR